MKYNKILDWVEKENIKGYELETDRCIADVIENFLKDIEINTEIPTNEIITDKARDYIHRTKIWTQLEKQALYSGYVQGAYWLRKQIKK